MACNACAHIQYWCEECRELIADGEGYIHCVPPYTDGRARWMVHHRACDPSPETFDYWFDIERARTHADLLSWTLHLSEKVWFPNTTWTPFVRRVLHESKAWVNA